MNAKFDREKILDNMRGEKILHIGNIANNAYQNAKMLNKEGVDCDVLSYDYYHIMGCPEWDDADFNGEVDANFPEWKKVDLQGFKRPRWFVAGPLWICRYYIIAKRKNNKLLANFYWYILTWVREEIAASKDHSKYTLLFIVKFILKIRSYLINAIRFVMALVIGGINAIWKSVHKEENIKQYMPKSKIEDDYVEDKLKRIRKDFKELFPDRECEFGDETRNLIRGAESFRKIVNEYDCVIAYATNPVWMYLIDFEQYIAYEHGTIRDMPYENNEFARLMLLAYAKAKAIYVTNVDCYDSAKYITQNIHTPVICGLHGIDIDSMIRRIDQAGEENIRKELGLESNEVVFFCPSRHSWDDKLQLFLKGQDKMLRAAGKVLKDFRNFKIILVNFGNDVDKIKKVIEDVEGLEEHILWIEPVKKEKLYKIYKSADAVIDQFVLKGYGAITFEVLAAQSALISINANENYQIEFFGEKLPYFSCDNEDEIRNSMKEVIEKTNRYKSYISCSRTWIAEHHSNDKIVDALGEAISYCI